MLAGQGQLHVHARAGFGTDRSVSEEHLLEEAEGAPSHAQGKHRVAGVDCRAAGLLVRQAVGAAEDVLETAQGVFVREFSPRPGRGGQHNAHRGISRPPLDIMVGQFVQAPVLPVLLQDRLRDFPVHARRGPFRQVLPYDLGDEVVAEIDLLPPSRALDPHHLAPFQFGHRPGYLPGAPGHGQGEGSGGHGAVAEREPLGQAPRRRRQVSQPLHQDRPDLGRHLQCLGIFLEESPAPRTAEQGSLFEQVLQHLLQEKGIPSDGAVEPVVQRRGKIVRTDDPLGHPVEALPVQGLERKYLPPFIALARFHDAFQAPVTFFPRAKADAEKHRAGLDVGTQVVEHGATGAVGMVKIVQQHERRRIPEPAQQLPGQLILELSRGIPRRPFSRVRQTGPGRLFEKEGFPFRVQLRQDPAIWAVGRLLRATTGAFGHVPPLQQRPASQLFHEPGLPGPRLSRQENGPSPPAFPHPAGASLDPLHFELPPYKGSGRKTTFRLPGRPIGTDEGPDGGSRFQGRDRPVFGVFFEHPAQQRGQGVPPAQALDRAQVHPRLELLLDQIPLIVVFEGETPAGQEVDQNSQGVDVGPCRRPAPQQHLGSDTGWGWGVGAIGEEPSQAVAQDNGASRLPLTHQQDVRRAQVPVHDPPAMQMVERCSQFGAHGERPLRGQGSGESSQARPLDPLLRQKQRPGTLGDPEVQDGDQARMPQAHQQGQGAPERAPLLPGRIHGSQQPENQVPRTVAQVPAGVDLPRPPTTQECFDPVPPGQDSSLFELPLTCFHSLPPGRIGSLSVPTNGCGSDGQAPARSRERSGRPDIRGTSGVGEGLTGIL